MYNTLLLLLTVFMALFYHPLNKRKTRRRLKTHLDSRIPLIALSIWPYMLFGPYLAYSVLALWSTALVQPFLLTLLFTICCSVLIWLVFPNGVTRPSLRPQKSISLKLLNFVYTHDGDSNGFPSAHVSYTIVATYYLTMLHTQYAVLLWLLAASIAISTLTTKQHYVIDLVGGVVVAMFAITIAGLAF